MTLFILRKLSLFILLVTCTLFLHGQEQLQGSINWQPAQEHAGGLKAPYYKGAVYLLENPAVPQFCATTKGSASLNYQAVLTSYSTTEVPAEERAALRDLELKATPQLRLTKGAMGQDAIISVCFYPYLKQNGRLLKITDYVIDVSPKAAPARAGEQSFRKSSLAASSVLSTEGWHKLSVSETGLFKITPQFLSDNNIASGDVAVSSLRIVGNGTGMLPEKNSAPRPDDLLDVPVEVMDQNNDGLFNGNDYAVFYAKGPHQWRFSGDYNHVMNVYRTANYYFISVSNGSGKAVITAPAVTTPATANVSSFDDYAFVEDEEVNLVGTGREWFGDVFDFTLTYSYDFSFPDLVKTEPVEVTVSALARASSSNTRMTVKLGQQSAFSLDFPQVATGDYAAYGRRRTETGTVQSPSDKFSISLEYDNTANPAAVAWLDYIVVQARRNLVYRSGDLLFRDSRSVGAGAVADFQISNAPPGLQVWDVTDHNNVVRMPLNQSSGTANFRAQTDELRQYAAFSGSGLDVPAYVGVVEPQNLHGLQPAEMLVVTHSNFLTAAQRLADFHQNYDQMSVHVVTVDQVYNEFSSGGQDVSAIRDFTRFMYNQAATSPTELKYLLLFGDASYDYKDRIANNSNFVPVYEYGSSLNLYSSSITDDYFAYLDSSDGGGNLLGQGMDVGVGRIPSMTAGQANAYVDKVMAYTTGEERFGDWRNRVLLMADDRDLGWEDTFVASSEKFTNIINNASEAFNVEKIYTDAYQQVSTTGSESYPDASQDMFRKVEQGNLITNYIGHGGEIGLSSERLLKLSDVNAWDNLENMPLFTTITCEFTRFDDPKRVSAGEQLALNPNGGAIALISTTRVVDAGTSIALNEEVFRTIFKRPDNQPKTLGTIIKDTKNELLSDGTKFKFSLIGDPAIRLAIPYYRMQVNSINGKPLAQAAIDTLQALSKVKVTGQVNDFGNQIIPSFNGVADVSVYDKAVRKKTLVNDGVGSPLPFDQRNNLLYRGKVEVVNGEFSFEFIVPKDISYQFGYGKISLYAHNTATDAAGYMDTVVVGGFNSDAPADNEGPLVELYINDENFVRGGITDKDPVMLAKVADSSGINTVGTGIGHDLVAVLDGKTDQSFVVNEYYEAALNSYQEGSIRYPFYDLEEGSHTLELQVFDVHNNVTKSATEFIVADSEELALRRVLNYPNPFTTYTEFQFEHNRAGQPLDVQVQIFTVSGQLVKTINQNVLSEGNRVTGVAWNGLDDYGDKIGKGVYVYRVKVRSQLDNSQADEYEKLVILR